MTSFTKVLAIGILLATVSAINLGDNFITVNTSATLYVISTSLATDLQTPFTWYSPALINVDGSTATLTPNAAEGELTVEPNFVENADVLYNDFSAGQHWYSFKTRVDPERLDSTATFAFSKLTIGSQTSNHLLPLFSLPLGILSFDRLYKCDDVLISYQRTGQLIDITVFSEEESWHLFPQTLWGFRHKDEEINFGRQTFPLGTTVEIDVGPSKYCVLSDSLPVNTYNLVEQTVYSLEDLLVKYSTTLELRDKTVQDEL